MPILPRTIIGLLLSLGLAAARADYSDDPRALQMYAALQSDYGFSAQDIEWVRRELAGARSLPQLISAEQNAKEKTLTWDAYRPIHVNGANIAAGQRFMRDNARWLARAEAEYGVPPQVVAAVLGVETKYGNFTGRQAVLDALATQGFDHPTRSDFFRSELLQLFVLCKRNGLDPKTLRGSYAGALGAAQFMPSNYLNLGVDLDGDGKVNLWSAADAIGSVANYLTHYKAADRIADGWQRGEPLYLPVTVDSTIPAALARNARKAETTTGALMQAGVKSIEPLPPQLQAGLVELKRGAGADYWVALPNFYRVMSYNPRVFYAASVTLLAEALALPQAMPATNAASRGTSTLGTPAPGTPAPLVASR